MPIPTPTPDETENEFMSRCIEFLINEGTPQEQAIAICSQNWEERKMIHCKALNKDFSSKKEMYKELVENKDVLIAQKKAQIKKADGFIYFKVNDALKSINKSDVSQIDLINTNAVTVKAIINTTNVMDSHEDVHIPGIWNKTLQEAKYIMHLQEHVMAFDHIIADGADLEAYTKYYDWKDLGYDFEGQTQALEFNSNVKKNRNEFMFNQYANGHVRNHSVGMQYVKIFLAVKDPDYPYEFEIWERYIDSIVNREKAEELGYFYAVTEAKIIEGSAVPLGSNHITPTWSVNPKSQIETELEETKEILKQLIKKLEPQEPGLSTQKSTYNNIDFLRQLNSKC